MSDQGERLYRIGEVCEQTGLPAHRIRWYEDEVRLIDGVLRTAGGQRGYTDVHIDRLKAIKRMREAGMSLKDIGLALRVLSSNALGVDVEGMDRVLELCASVRARIGVAEELVNALRRRALARDRHPIKA